MDDWIFGLNPPYGERVMALKPKTLQEAISIMGELDIVHQFCRRDGKGQPAQTQGGQTVGGVQKGKNGKKNKNLEVRQDQEEVDVSQGNLRERHHRRDKGINSGEPVANPKESRTSPNCNVITVGQLDIRS